MEIYFLIGYILTLFIQIFFYLAAFFSLRPAQNENLTQKIKKVENIKTMPSLTIVVCGRNEADNWCINLPHLLQQQYAGEWQIIAVDDDSTDHSQEVLTHFASQYPQKLSVIYLKNKQKAGKKVALKAGIKAAKSEWILLTDADCQPNSSDWITKMINKGLENSQTEIVLGFSPYEEKNTLLSAWIGYETALTGLQYLSFAGWGRAYMGVGRNLLYKKSLFLEKNSFEEDKIASGDDDLFINKASNSQNTAICLHQESFSKSNPALSWTHLYWQKKRHFMAGNFYKTSAKISLFILAQSHFWTHIGLLLWLIFTGINPLILGFWLLRNLIVWAATAYICGFIFNYKKNLYLLPFFDLVVPIYYCIFAAVFTHKQKKLKWK